MAASIMRFTVDLPDAGASGDGCATAASGTRGVTVAERYKLRARAAECWRVPAGRTAGMSPRPASATAAAAVSGLYWCSCCPGRCCCLPGDRPARSSALEVSLPGCSIWTPACPWASALRRYTSLQRKQHQVRAASAAPRCSQLPSRPHLRGTSELVLVLCRVGAWAAPVIRPFFDWAGRSKHWVLSKGK